MSVDPVTAAYQRAAKSFADKAGIPLESADEPRESSIKNMVIAALAAGDTPDEVLKKVAKEFPHLPTTDLETTIKIASNEIHGKIIKDGDAWFHVDNSGKRTPIEEPSDPDFVLSKSPWGGIDPKGRVWIDGSPASKVKKMATTKTASETGGSQVQTMKDAGDYQTHSQALADQAKEVKESAPDGTDQGGTQNQTANYKDKSYSQTGSGAAKLAGKDVIATVQAIAGVDPGAAAKFIRMAADDTTAPMGGPPPGAEDDAPAADAGADPAAAPAAADSLPQAAAPSADQQAAVKLQEIVKDKENQLTVDKEVADQLKSIMQEVSAGKITPVVGAQRRAAVLAYARQVKHSTRRSTAVDTTDKGKKTETVSQGANKVPHSSVDPKDLPIGGTDPDWELYDTFKTADESKTEGHSGQQFAQSSDRGYTLAQWRRKLELGKRVAKSMVERHKAAGLDIKTAVAKVRQTKEGQALERIAQKVSLLEKSSQRKTAAGEFTKLDSLWKQFMPKYKAWYAKWQDQLGDDENAAYEAGIEDEAKEWQDLAVQIDSVLDSVRETFAGSEEDRGWGPRSPEVVQFLDQMDRLTEGEAAASDMITADVSPDWLQDLYDGARNVITQGGDVPAKSARRRTAAGDASGKDVGGNIPPDEQKHSQGDDTTRYDSKSKGDTKKDEISKGTDTTLESPETGSSVDSARSELDSKHNADVRGATVAMNARERAAVNGVYAEARKLAANVAASMPKVANLGSRNTASTLSTHLGELKADYDALLPRLASAAKAGKRHEIRALVTALTVLNKSATRELKNISALGQDIVTAKTRMTRLPQAFKLAMRQYTAGLLDGNEVGGTLANYMKMGSKEFDVESGTIERVIAKTAQRRPMQRTASSIPSMNIDSVTASALQDDLDGLFDE